MNRRDRGILYGLSLGDGSLSYRPERGSNCEFILGHSVKQKAYIEHKAKMLHSIIGGNAPNIHPTKTKLKNGKTYHGLRFSKTHKYFNQIHKNLYPQGRKVYTRKILDFLTEEGIALWFMDDGSMRCNKNKQGEVTSLFADITTHCSKEEAEIIQLYFQETWGIETKIRKSKGAYNIGFNTRACHRLTDFIWPYIIPSMRYKFRFLEDFVFRTSARHPKSDMTGDDIVRPKWNDNA